MFMLWVLAYSKHIEQKREKLFPLPRVKQHSLSVYNCGAHFNMHIHNIYFAALCYLDPPSLPIARHLTGARDCERFVVVNNYLNMA